MNVENGEAMGRFRDLIFPQGGCKLISSFPVLAATLFAFLLLPRCYSTSLTRDRLDPDFHPTLDPAQSAHVLRRITIHGFEECQPFQPEVLLYEKRRRQRQEGTESIRKLEKTSFAEKQRIADLPDETTRNEQIREELSEIVRNPWIQSSTCEHFALRSHLCGGQPEGRGPAIVGRGFESSKDAPQGTCRSNSILVLDTSRVVRKFIEAVVPVPLIPAEALIRAAGSPFLRLGGRTS